MASQKQSTPSLSRHRLHVHALSCLNFLLKTIDSKDWAAFNKIAIQNPRAFQALSSVIETTHKFDGTSLMHMIVGKRPPLKVVVDTIKICPDSPKARDGLNRTPLHVAAGIGASAQIVNCLIMAYPEACQVQDRDGRTPLHLACDAGSDGRDSPSFEVICALLSASVAPACMEDGNEKSPLECAILSNADLRVVKLLQTTARKYMRRKHEEGNEDERGRPTSELVAAA